MTPINFAYSKRHVAVAVVAPQGSATTHALEAGGIEFIAENGGGPGVRLKKSPQLNVGAEFALTLRSDHSRQAMEFRIQYFGEYDRMLYAEEVKVDTLDVALERARAIANGADPAFADPAIIGYVILDDRGRLVARGYKRQSAPI